MPISGEDSDPITVVNNVKRVQMWKGMTDAGEHVLFPAITVVSDDSGYDNAYYCRYTPARHDTY